VVMGVRSNWAPNYEFERPGLVISWRCVRHARYLRRLKDIISQHHSLAALTGRAGPQALARMANARLTIEVNP
jgi:hypothetical protein